MPRSGLVFLFAAAVIFGALIVASAAQNGNYTRHTEIHQTVTTTVDGQTTVRNEILTDSWLAAPYHSDQVFVRDGHSYRTVIDRTLLREWFTQTFPFLPFRPPEKSGQ